jgi:hypothetical protein
MAGLDTASLRRVGGQRGSNPAGLFEAADGRRYYVKTLESAALARNEKLAAALYQLAGAPTLRYVPTLRPHEVATEWMVLDKARLALFNEAERLQAQQALGVHAWTANWDAVGLLGDNLGVAQGRVLTLDLGAIGQGAAQGDPKGKAFGTRVDELDTLRHSADNPAARQLFGAMTPQAVRAAIQQVTALPPQQIGEVIARHGGSPALAAQMLARQADMARQLADPP